MRYERRAAGGDAEHGLDGLCKTLLNKFSSAWMHKSSKLAVSDE